MIELAVAPSLSELFSVVRSSVMVTLKPCDLDTFRDLKLKYFIPAALYQPQQMMSLDHYFNSLLCLSHFKIRLKLFKQENYVSWLLAQISKTFP